MEKIRIIICDDYEPDRLYYENLTRQLAKKYQTPVELKTYASGDALLADTQQEAFLASVQMIFLDILMPGKNGIEVAQAIRAKNYAGLLIFLTASTKHYEPAFDLRSFNYITKTENAPKRFEKVFVEALKQVKRAGREAVILTGGGRYQQIAINQIKYFEVLKNMLTVHYGKDKEFSFISSLKKIELQLENKGFYRVQKSFLVNIAYIREVSSTQVTLWDGSEIPVGRKYYQELKAALEELAGQTREMAFSN